jgi:cleavage and polyadenylation specificity factor subunit 2
VAPTVNAVLLSHADLPHIGALPYAMSKLGLPTDHIYATGPVKKMGQMFMYDTYQSFRAVEEFILWDLDDVDAVFESIRLVKVCV